MHLKIKTLSNNLNAVANVNRASGAKAYMKNQFEFLGIPMPERRWICKAWMKEMNITNEEELQTMVREFWLMEEREFQYCAIELMAFHKKLWKENIISVFEHCVKHKSWWDTVDFISSECLGPYFKIFPGNIEKITGRWNISDNMWLQRSSLLFQKNYKEHTDIVLLSKYIKHLATSKEFFIRKAIGWVLREYAKTDPQWVLNFVNNHELSSLSKREALKNIF